MLGASARRKVMSELVSIKRPDGGDCPAYVARPSGAHRGGIVVIQEWWGLNEQIKQTADRLAAEGFLVTVPDLYRGKVASDAEEANHMMSNLDWSGAASQDVPGCLQFLRGEGAAKVGVTGFCMGGALTILAALACPDMDCGVCFYGIPPAEAGDPGTISKPMQFHFAQHDDWCTPDAVDALEKTLKDGGVSYELYRYDAHHAFMNEKRPEVYDEASATQAWQRALAFFGKQLV
jgi:carboxymethylenebutenolidase